MTQLKYLEDSYCYTDQATVLKAEPYTDSRTQIILDQTIFYPQGGGQPYDKGTLTTDDGAVFDVQEVRFVDGEVLHVGEFTEGEFATNAHIHLSIDPDRRLLNSKLQSAGHLIDMAIRDIGYDYLVPSKGFHFPEGPNVEYEGIVPEQERGDIVDRLNAKLREMIIAGYEVKTKIVMKDELADLCYSVPPQIPEGKPVRIVSVWGDEYMPCGATHVRNISELQNLQVTKLKCKGGGTKVSYSADL